MTQPNVPPWWARIVGDFLTMVAFVALLWWMDAPDWALVLAMLVCTRTSSVHTSLDRVAIQSTLRRLSIGLDLLCRVVAGDDRNDEGGKD